MSYGDLVKLCTDNDITIPADITVAEDLLNHLLKEFGA